MRAALGWRRPWAGGAQASAWRAAFLRAVFWRPSPGPSLEQLDARQLLAELPARLGLPGGAGLALLAWAAWLAWAQLPAREAETAALQEQTRQARRQMLAAARPAAQRPATPQQTLAAVHARLAARGDRAPALAAVLERARAAGLQVQSAAYRMEPAAGGGVQRHEVALPVKGEYAAVRGWLAKVLAQQPALSLDALSLKRADAQAGVVDARVALSLWVRQDGAAASAASLASRHGAGQGAGPGREAGPPAAPAAALALGAAPPSPPAARTAPARIDGWPADRTLVATQAVAPASRGGR